MRRRTRGKDRELELEAKRELRRDRWAELRALGAARFPGAVGRIPNFTGAEAAAARLAHERLWHRAGALKCNPDLPQRPVRHRALLEGKRVYVAVPRLADRHPFLLLDPERLTTNELWRASSIAGALELGRVVPLGRVSRIDLVVTGCVGVAPDGARLGKGSGYVDLEYALLREAGKLTPRTPIVATAHPSQLMHPRDIPMLEHDVPVDWIVTPDEVLRCERTYRRPSGIRWSALEPARRAAIPVLARRRAPRDPA